MLNILNEAACLPGCPSPSHPKWSLPSPYAATCRFSKVAAYQIRGIPPIRFLPDLYFKWNHSLHLRCLLTVLTMLFHSGPFRNLSTITRRVVCRYLSRFISFKALPEAFPKEGGGQISLKQQPIGQLWGNFGVARKLTSWTTSARR